jgi:hypothetical protein
LWQRFPETSIVTIASKLDFAGTAETLQLLVPEKERKNFAARLQLGAGLFGLDLFKDVLPNIGPDWGVCVLPAKDARHLPQTLLAIAASPGKNDPPVDQTLYQAVNSLTQGLIDFNKKKHPDSPIRLQKVRQDGGEIAYLAGEIFPAGIQPCCTVKDGFFLLGSSPEAVAQFRRRDNAAPSRKENLLFRLSPPELAKLLRQRHEEIVADLKQRQQMSEKDARKNLDSMISLAERFERVTLSQHGEPGQAVWTLRITPAPPAPPAP